MTTPSPVWSFNHLRERENMVSDDISLYLFRVNMSAFH